MELNEQERKMILSSLRSTRMNYLGDDNEDRMRKNVQEVDDLIYKIDNAYSIELVTIERRK